MAERSSRGATSLTAVRGGKASARSRSRKTPEINSVKSAAEGGTDRDLLVQLRNRIAADIDDPGTPPRDLAALTRRIQEIVKDIKALDARDGEDAGAGPVPDGSFDSSAL
jgi:hypothetical protein